MASFNPVSEKKNLKLSAHNSLVVVLYCIKRGFSTGLFQLRVYWSCKCYDSAGFGNYHNLALKSHSLRCRWNPFKLKVYKMEGDFTS